MSFMQFLEKSVKLGTKSLVFLRNFRRNIPEKFSGISWGKIPEKFSGIPRDYVLYEVPQKIRKIRDQVLSISQEFPEKFSGNSWEKFRRNSQEFLETKSQYYEPQKISKIGD